jgi:adenylate cyclase
VESLTKDFKVRIVVTAETARQAGTGFSFRPLGSVQVKGRSGGVEVLELTGLNKAKTEGSAS